MQRWDADLRSLGWHAHSEAIEHMTDVLIEAATVAEMRRRGGGLRVLMERLGHRLLLNAAAVGRKN